MELINMKDGGVVFVLDDDISGMDYKEFAGNHYGIDDDDGYGGKVITAIIHTHRKEVFEVPCLYSEYLGKKTG
jgi:hypothetical protein